MTGDPDFTLGGTGRTAGRAAITKASISRSATTSQATTVSPPYGMSYDVAQKRNVLPVPASQYGDPGAGGTYNCWDEINLNPPAGAVYATIDLLYQGTSWEYIQFLWKANNGQNAFLGQEGVNMLDAWINADVPSAVEVAGDRKMMPPVIMASTTWGTPPVEDADDDSVPDNQDNCINTPNADQRDTNGDGYGNICDADLDPSGFVDAGDLSIYRARRTSTNPDADFNGSGFVDAADPSISPSLYRASPGSLLYRPPGRLPGGDYQRWHRRDRGRNSANGADAARPQELSCDFLPIRFGFDRNRERDQGNSMACDHRRSCSDCLSVQLTAPRLATPAYAAPRRRREKGGSCFVY